MKGKDRENKRWVMDEERNEIMDDGCMSGWKWLMDEWKIE